MILSLSALAVTAVVLSKQVAAQTSLWIPGLDPQPVTADQLGVGPDGATTWLIAPGVSSGTLGENGFFGPATLIAGPSSAEFIYSDASQSFGGDEKCIIKGTEADCTAVVVIDGATSTMATIETVSPFPIQGGGPLDDSSTPAAGSSPTTLPSQTSTPDSSGTPAAGSSPTTMPSQTSTPDSSSTPALGASNSGSTTQSTGAPVPTNTENGAATVGYSVAALWFAVSGLGMLIAA